MLETSKADRLELYKDHGVQVFLGKFLSGEIVDLEPTYDPKVGYHYAEVEAIVGDESKVEAFLKRLHETGMLERKLHDKIIYCPKCGSGSVSVRYCCPFCRSFDIQRSSLVEHVKCGYMDVEENFRQGSKLICPKCHEELKRADIDYRKAGIWCSCRDCNKSFDIPLSSHFCRDCRGSFTFEEIVIKEVYTYSLRREVKEEVGLEWSLVGSIKELLIRDGFEVEAPAFLKGKSKANHMFDVIAREKETQGAIVIDVATSIESSVSEQPVIALFAKTFDVSPDAAYLIAVPKISDTGRKMAELYSIRVVEAKGQKEAAKALRARMLKE